MFGALKTVMRLAALLVAFAISAPARAAERCALENADSPSAEELYNAGVCYETAKSLGVAIMLFSQLRQRHPASPLAQKALVRLANLNAAIARYREAADLYADYARRYAAERDAPHALSEAARLYAALGHDREALRAAETFIKLYGRKRAGDAAEVMFFAASLLERRGDDRALVKHLEGYVKQFGARGGRDRAAIAHARIGKILWERSCPVAVAADGLCRRPLPRRAQVDRCDDSVIATRRIARDRALVREARRYLTRATTIFAARRATSARERAALAAVTEAEMLLLEQDFEAYLDLTFPGGLDFDSMNKKLHDKSLARFRAWLQIKQKAGVALSDRYRALIRRSPTLARMAAARAAQVSLDLRDQLMSGAIPRNIRRGPYAADLRAAYCGALGDEAGPLEATAVGAFELCVGQVAPRGDPWTALCQRQLEQLRPKQHPPAREVHGDATHLAPILDRAGEVY
jgi:outer membrane protein assembly factor BamD (BamD/ComL family)